MECKCCGEQISDRQQDEPVNNRYGQRVIGIVRCNHCDAIQGHCYKGEFSGLIKMSWDTDPNADSRYFDIETVGSAGVERHHGWYNPKTWMITQIG